MNAVTIIEAAPVAHLDLPPDLSCTDWMDIGRDLMRKDRETKWMAADWMAYGRARSKVDSEFAKQMDLHLPEILEDPRKLDAIARVAEIFPPDERSLDLSFDHYSALASLPHGEARKLLEKAAKDRANVRQMRYDIIGAQMKFDPPEPSDDDLLTAFLRHWNNLPKHVRLDAIEMLNEAEGGVVEP